MSEHAHAGAVAGDLTFDAAAHRYFWKGEPVPGVSAVLDCLGFSDFEHVPPDVLANKAKLGTDVHAATVLIQKGTLDWASVDEAMLPYLQAWEQFRHDADDWKVLLTEEPVYDPSSNTAGTPDRVMRTPHDDVLLDIKCGVEVVRHRLQTAAYVRILNAQKWQRHRVITRRCGLYLRATGRYKIQWHDDLAGDLRAFAACRQLYEWRARNGAL